MDQGSLRTRRHKSFAGCWTCRARKVKCDETRPRCVQCSLKHLCCEGYEVRLRWMLLEAGSFAGRDATGKRFEEELDAGSQRPQRSLVICEENEQSPLQLSELDDIFTQIDNFQCRKPQSPQHEHRQLFLSNFGVFDPSSQSAGYDGGALPDYPTESPQEPPSLCSNSYSDSWEPETGHEDYVPEPLSSGFGLTGFGALLRAHETTANVNPDPDSGTLVLPDTSSESPVASLAPLNFDYCISQPCYQPQHHASPPSHHTPSRDLWWKDTTNTIIHNPSPLPLPEHERFLLNHYVHRVVHLFCVISYEKSPWKTIHLPRVLQSAGQLSLHGSTSTVRMALRNALLSISAFYLANDCRSRGDGEERWEGDAIMYRGRAIKLLKETVERSTPESRPKYKELLATMLSMITINVMSGDTSTCGIHLDGAFRFMNHIRSSKSKYSSKARSLHRIYFYLRVIYDSTACRNISSSNNCVNDTPPSPEADFGTALSVSLLDNEVDTDQDPGTGKSVLNHITAPKAHQVGEYECVYGVPQSLLILLARTTDLIDQVTTSRHHSGSSIPLELASQCDKLESDIIDWESPSPTSTDTTSPSAAIIQKTTLAFHNALIIYFAQHIRLLHHSYLTSHILLVLSSIEAIETIKSDSNIPSAPLYWPAFIAGSEAFEKGLQERFREWYVRVEPYRLASVRSGIDVLREIWGRGPGGRGGTSIWRKVVQETGVRLMLS